MNPEIERLTAGIREIESAWEEFAETRRLWLLEIAEDYALGILSGSVRNGLEARAEQYQRQRTSAVCAARRAEAKRFGIESASAS